MKALIAFGKLFFSNTQSLIFQNFCVKEMFYNVFAK